MELSKRLRMVASMVEKDSVAADVGCDHGYVSIWLVREGICPRVLAMDVNEGPLARARGHVEEAGLSSYIELRRSDGLSGMVRGETDTLLAAGIGGRLASRILREGADKLAVMRQAILQPQSEPWLVRDVLEGLGYLITEERMIQEEGKFYSAMKAANGRFLTEADRRKAAEAMEMPEGMELTEIQWRRLAACHGPLLIRSADPVLAAYLEELLRKHQWIRDRIRREQVSGNGNVRIGQMEEEDGLLERLLSWMRKGLAG